MTTPRDAHPVPSVPGNPVSRRTVLTSAAAAAVLAGVAGIVGAGDANAATAHTDGPSGHGPARPTRPTIVLVHGAFADASSWNDVIGLLQHDGYTVFAPANPLRGIASDADYLRTFLATLTGPIVLAGHSYGGAAVTNAATGNPAVQALVYIAAYALDQGETIGAANTLGGGTALLGQHIVVRPFPGAGPGDVEAYVDPAFFREVFAQDLTARRAAIMAAAQRPLVASALGTPSGVPAWRTIPSWYLVASHDHAIPPEAERAMAARAGAHTVEIASSHIAMVSHPRQVTDLIIEAACRP
jgi:pimeloyl-ACP methyl ester carboxylesterase